MTLPTKLFHYSGVRINELKTDFYEECEPLLSLQFSMKPNGFWFSVEESENDYSWFQWCQGSSFRLKNLKYKYLVKIAPNANILHLTTRQELIDFSDKYSSVDDATLKFHGKVINREVLNWRRVKEEYDGIIISPYQWDCRLSPETFWYNFWDCSSGCIWNLDKISVKLCWLFHECDLKKAEDPTVGSWTGSQLEDLDPQV